MNIYKIPKNDLKFNTPSFSNLTIEEIINNIFCIGEKRLGFGGFHPTRSMSYMMRIKNNDVIQLLHLINEYYKIEKDDYVLYPYMFNFSIHGNKKNIITSNWFSGMGQGFALIAYTRFNDKSISEKILNSFESSEITKKTQYGYHYMEYPNHCDALNGHIFSLYGLYEYWHKYQCKKAKRLLIEGIRWVKHILYKYRNVGGPSFYCTDHKILCNKVDGKYHKVHIEQLNYLGLITKDDWFNKQVNLFKKDFPVSGDVIVLSNEK